MGVITPDMDAEQFTERVLSIEMQVECAVQRPCPEVIEVLRYLKNANISTCLISDFYLPEKSFMELLDHHGMGGLFNALYVSGELGLSKGASGRLYHHVLNEQNLLPEQLCMVGDNPHADGLMAEKAGLHSFLLDRTEQHRLL
jgi:predicted HAD superfamily hydrolase